MKARFLNDINAISCAWTPAIVTRLKKLFFKKWEANANLAVKGVTAHFKNEWCNIRLGNRCSGHCHDSIINTNGLEATNKVVKDELTKHQLLPVTDFLRATLLWVQEQSLRREIGPNQITFDQMQTFSKRDWTEAHDWRVTFFSLFFLGIKSSSMDAAAPSVRPSLSYSSGNKNSMTNIWPYEIRPSPN